MINSAEVDLDSSAVLYEARVMPKDELTITVNCPEDAEAVIPFNLTATPAVGQGRGTLTSQPTLQTFLVTNEGTINYPVLGTLKVGGMTVNQVEDLIASKIEGTYLKTRPVVTVRLSNYKISVLGEVTSPGTYTVPSEKVSIYGALALAKDMTVYGRRDNVKLIREDATGKKTIHELDLNDANIIKSPYFLLAAERRAVCDAQQDEGQELRYRFEHELLGKLYQYPGVYRFVGDQHPAIALRRDKIRTP